jgi:hypothetical protein
VLLGGAGAGFTAVVGVGIGADISFVVLRRSGKGRGGKIELAHEAKGAI